MFDLNSMSFSFCCCCFYLDLLLFSSFKLHSSMSENSRVQKFSDSYYQASQFYFASCKCLRCIKSWRCNINSMIRVSVLITNRVVNYFNPNHFLCVNLKMSGKVWNLWKKALTCKNFLKIKLQIKESGEKGHFFLKNEGGSIQYLHSKPA